MHLLLCTTLSSQMGCWSSCILPRCVRKNLEKGICKWVNISLHLSRIKQLFSSGLSVYVGTLEIGLDFIFWVLFTNNSPWHLASRVPLWCTGNNSICHLSGERNTCLLRCWSSKGGHRHAHADAACWNWTSHSASFYQTKPTRDRRFVGLLMAQL